MDQEELLRLVTRVESHSTNRHSTLHGPQHWRTVSLTGIELSLVTPGADAMVAFLFGLFHDARRVNDDNDPGHGRRGAKLARELLPDLAPTILGPLVSACATHTEARPTDDPVLGVCYDADRLNLWRVGIVPNAWYLSTQAAPGMIERTRHLHESPLEWSSIVDRLGER